MKRKIKLGNIIIIVTLITGLILLGLYFFKEDFSLDVFNQNNSETYLKAQEMSLFKSEYSEYYNNIDYVDDDDFIVIINTLLDKEYTVDEINNIYKHLKKENIDKLLEKDYIELSDFFGISNFDVDKYERYIGAIDEKATAVFKRDSLTLSDVVTFVNIGLDKKFYATVKKVSEPEDILVLVNKYNILSSTYVPNDLVEINGPVANSDARKFELRKVAAEGFTKLVTDAYKVGYTIFPYSAYRSYDYQNSLYNGYVIKDGKESADTYSARPGHSEHQLGLAVDIRSPEYSNKLNNSAFKWVAENAHKYGFIVRYPEGQIDITGYMYEDWHLRYLGVETATDVYEKNITYDEYYDLYVK